MFSSPVKRTICRSSPVNKTILFPAVRCTTCASRYIPSRNQSRSGRVAIGDRSEERMHMQEERASSSSSSMDSSELRRVFQMFDKNGDGQITKKELGESLRNLGIYIPDDELDATMGKIDANGDGCVDVEEFGMLYRSIVGEGHVDGTSRDEEDMREAFNVFDQNGDGYITVEELRSVLSSLGLKQGRTAEDCRRMISKVDADGDGRVDFTEFKQMMRGGGFAAL